MSEQSSTQMTTLENSTTKQLIEFYKIISSNPSDSFVNNSLQDFDEGFFRELLIMTIDDVLRDNIQNFYQILNNENI